ncbi:MAG: hypothetical protein V1760_03765 [Candidatus Peregrinibacteria bacterium]
MKFKITFIALLFMAPLLLAGCQKEPQIDIDLPTAPPNPANFQPSYGPNGPVQ